MNGSGSFPAQTDRTRRSCPKVVRPPMVMFLVVALCTGILMRFDDPLWMFTAHSSSCNGSVTPGLPASGSKRATMPVPTGPVCTLQSTLAVPPAGTVTAIFPVLTWQKSSGLLLLMRFMTALVFPLFGLGREDANNFCSVESSPELWITSSITLYPIIGSGKSSEVTRKGTVMEPSL